jgi:hypothetical protein
MREKKKNKFSTIFILLGFIVILALPNLFSGKASSILSTPPIQKSAAASLNQDQQAGLEKLYAQLKSGAQFSHEETAILNRFGAGQPLSDIEADIVISRALYDFYVAGKALTKEQEELLDRYTLLVARRPTDVLDLKLQLLNKRIAAAATAAPQAPLVAPPNDQCAGAEVIPAAGPFPHFTAVTADITDATTVGDPPLPSCQTNVSRSIWYRFTPSATATYDFSTCASDGTASTVDDTVLAVYTSSTSACGGVFTQVPLACDDDFCVSESLQSVILNLTLNAGTTYFIVVWQFDTPPPTAGNTAIQLRVARTLPPANETCVAATALALNTPVTGTTMAAFNDYQLTGATCFTGVGQTSSTATGREVVYSFTAPTANTFSFKVTNYAATGNLVLYATSSCPAATPGTPVNITCNNISGPAFLASNRAAGSSSEELMCLSLTASQQIFIFVDDNTPQGMFIGSTFTIEATTCTRETEANNTPATANSFGAQAFGIEGSITPVGDVDFFSLGTPASGSRVFALLDGVASNSSDFDMRVTTTVDTLEYDDLNADVLFGTLGPAIGGTPVSGVSVFLRVDGFDDPSPAIPPIIGEPYQLYYTIQPPGANALPACPATTTSATAETEPNNTAAQANSAANKYFSGSLPGPAPSTDVDVFSFSLSAGQLVFLSLDGDPCRNNTPINGRLELLDTNGSTVLITVNDGGSASSTTSGAGSLTATTPSSPSEGIAYRVTASGTYFARVSIGTTSTGTTGAGDYLLSIATSAPTAAKFGNETARVTTTATGYADGVSVKWKSGFEVENLGFNIYREEGSNRIRINSDIVAGSALTVGANTLLAAGNSYAWFDKTSAGANTRYLIEAIDINGQSSWSAPFSIAEFNGKPSTTQERSATFEQLGRTNAAPATTARVEKRATLKPVSLSASDLPDGLAGRAAAKIFVSSEGIYRLTQSELVAAGFNANVDPQTLQLFVDGVEQSINVVAPNRQFDASAYLEFYGTGVDSAVTSERVYWLIGGLQTGKRIQTIFAPTITKGDGSFAYDVELKPRTIYFSALRNGDKENFFGSVVAHTPVEQSLTIQRLDKASTRSAVLEVALQGVTQSAHRVQVEINGVTLGEVNFNLQNQGLARFNFPLSALKDGANSVRLTPVGGSADISLIDYLRLTYQHLFIADNNQLKLSAAGKQTVSIDGFTSSSIRVFDVTDANATQEITGSLKQTPQGYAISFTTPGSGERKIMAMTSAVAKHPANLKLNQPSAWRQSINAANLVIFASRELFPAFETLKAFRQTQGHKVALVDIEDVYDEFSYGNKTPDAIKGFLGYARTAWKVKPTFAIFGGDASFDPKNYLGAGDWDAVPTKLIDTLVMETASDDWLADLNGDGFAEIATGRLPARNPTEAVALVNKIIGYEQTRPEGILLMADESSDGANFEATSNELQSLLAGEEQIEQINRSGLTQAEARAQLLAALNRGVKIACYFGHANVDTWREGLLTSADAATLDNQQNLSLFVSMSCLNGYFNDPQRDSLSEALLKAKGGAVAVWASSGMTAPSDHSAAHLALFNQLFKQADSPTLGEAVLKAKSLTLNTDVRRTWILFGDPSSRVKR